MSDWMFKKIGLLERGLDAVWKRNEIIADNIANVDTPGFKASSLEFESLLAEELELNDSAVKIHKSRDKHMDNITLSNDSIKPVITKNENLTMRMDGNNVDIDREMASLAKNNLLYNALIQKISGELGRIRMAVQEGRK